MGDHDSLFKRAFSVPANAAGELRSVLPTELVAKIDLTSLEVVPASFVDAELSHRHADLLFTAAIAGQPSHRYFLFEHQSEPDTLMPWRVLEYMQRIWSATLRDDPTRTTLRPIITIVVHHGAQGWTAPRRFHEIVEGLDASPELRTFVPDFELLIDDLASADDTELHSRPLAAFPKVTLWLLRDARSVERWATRALRVARVEDVFDEIDDKEYG
jgi:predicted transposase/invertase (TIGR01784 family)